MRVRVAHVTPSLVSQCACKSRVKCKQLTEAKRVRLAKSQPRQDGPLVSCFDAASVRYDVRIVGARLKTKLSVIVKRVQAAELAKQVIGCP